MRKATKLLSLLLAVAMLLSLSAFASGEASGETSGEASGASSGGGGIDLTGMLALKQYVFVASEGEIDGDAVSTDLYGVYAKGGEGEAAFVPEAFDGAITVYADSAMTEPAAGVAAAADKGVLTLTGVDAKANTAYYLSTGEDAYATVIYVVGDEYADNAATLTLADGTTMQLTTYAPNMAYGDYAAVTDANPIEGDTAVYIGGNRTAVTLDDLTDPENFAGHEAAAAWYLRSGITNAGKSLTTFGDKLYGYEYAVGMYRLFQIVVDQTTSVAGYTDPTDFVGGMGVNDPYSDAVSATLQADIWNGIYTRYSDVKDLGEGFYLTENIPGVDTLGTGAAVDVEFAYVGMFNAFASVWTMLNADGEAMADALIAAAAAYDGASAEPSGEGPVDYSNEAKIAAVSSVLLGEDAVPAADKVLTKAEAVEVLYAAKDYVQGKIAPDGSRAEATGSEYADMSQYFGPAYGNTVIVTPENLAEVQAGVDDMDLISEENAALLVNNAGELTVTNNTISLTGSADNVGSVLTSLSDPRYTLDGAEAATDPTHDGFVYNATTRNAFYRFAVGTALGVWGKDTVVNLRSDNGTLVLDGEAASSTPPGTMAGTAYVGFGGTLNITNAVAYSASQHLTNSLYNGTIHYVDAAAFGSGRVYSSDFWGGYQVFEDSIATGGSVTDEPTTLVVKNSVYANSVGGNGFASQYFENAILNVGTATFDNKTSLTTDAGALTLVNSVMNDASAKLFAVNGCERAIITVVDSELNVAGSVLASVGNRDGVNNVTDVTVDPADMDAYKDMWDGEMIVRFYGDVTIDAEGALTVDVAEGGELTVCSANLTEADITNTGAGTLTIVTDPAYGTVTVK